jgi:hypothetical protein
MALAFSLMALATGIVGMVVVSDKQAKASASELVTRTTLESATEQALFGLERDGSPDVGEWEDSETLNGLDVTVTFAPVHFKPDLNKSGADAIGAAFVDAALRDRVLAALAPPTPGDPRPAFKRFIDFVHAVGADASAEDCLRRRLTIGRAAGSIDPAPAVNALVPTRSPLTAGFVLDVRAETRDAEGRREVLWRRVRFTGKPAPVWLTHDWRMMRLPRQDANCPAPDAAPSIGRNTLQP